MKSSERLKENMINIFLKNQEIKMPKIKRKIKKKGKLKTKKILKLKKKNVKLKLKNENNENKPISSNQEEKPEIKKIKKQPSEKRQYNVKDFVVYPKHGVGKITAVEKANIGQIEIQFYKIYIDKEKLTLTVPINQQANLRPISSINQINKCVSILKTKPKVKRTMWSRRAQEYDQKINSGKIYELAEVVKDLNKNTDIIADQSYSERQLFEKAYDRLKSEFEAVLKITPEEVQKKMNKALGRTQNLEEN
jgi:CarD family transcriptional regulator